MKFDEINDTMLMQAFINFGQQVDTKPQELLAEADHVYILWRNALLDMWAESTAAARGVSLLRMHEKIMALLYEVEPVYANMLFSSDYETDEEAIVLALSYGLAALRWHHKLRNGRLPESINIEPDELEAWLKKQVQRPVIKDPNQRSLFDL